MNKIYQTRIGFLIFVLALLLTSCSLLTRAEATTEPVLQQSDEVIGIVEPATETFASPQPEVIEPLTEAQPMAPAVDNTAVSDALAVLADQEQAFINVYEQVNPAVVHIAVGAGQGSGFVYDQAGYIITNNHVVQGGGEIVVTFADGSQLPAQVVGTDPASDLAVIRVNAEPGELTAVTLADTDTLRVGQIVLAIGSPFGLSGTMTSGIISGLNRPYASGLGPNGASFQIPDIIQTDAAINPGNSGGPLLDLQGAVIGVNTAIESPVRGSSGIGYAVPANVVRVVVPQLIANGRVQHPWLGIAGGALTPTIAESLGLDPEQNGIFVSDVVAGGPAAQAGLRGNNNTGTGGDIIVSIDDRTIEEFDDLLGYIVEHTMVGQTVSLQILRDGQLQSVSITLQARPASS